nr:ribosomal protein S14 [Gephyrocapsa parvula]
MTKQNYFKLRNKDKNLRYKFLKNENQILVKKVVNDCNILSSTKAKRFYTKYFRNSKNLIRNYCLLTANSKSIIGKFRLSRYKFKDLVATGNLTGIFKF